MIRKANIKDIPDMIKLGRAMHDESSYSGFVYDEEKCKCLFDIWIKDEDKYFLIVDDKDGEIRGGFGAFINPYLYGIETNIIASDLFLYVKPEYRGTSIAIKLIKEYEQWAKEKGASRICLAHSCEIQPEKLDNLYSKLGFKLYAKAFRKGI